MNPAIPPDPERTRVVDDNLVMHWLKRADLALKTISYAQNHEDILLARALPDCDGFFIDVGANHPVFHSVTKLFTDRGWSGINIEPSPPIFDRLQHDRPDQINLNVGVGDVATTLTFYETPTLHGWSTFRLELAEHYRSIGVGVVERPVPVRTLSEVCAEHVGNRPIDFLKVDAEGFEKQVLFGMDFGRWRPRVLLIENVWPSEWEAHILAAGYLHAAFDGLNRFYVRAEDQAILEAFRAPVNILDNFVPYEYVRLMDDYVRLIGNHVQSLGDHVRSIEELNRKLAIKTSLIDALRADAPRVARKLRAVVGRLGGRRAG